MYTTKAILIIANRAKRHVNVLYVHVMRLVSFAVYSLQS
jgi:hypothetical protein